MPAARASATPRATSAWPTPWPRNAAGTSVWSMMTRRAPALEKVISASSLADAVDVAALAVALLEGDVGGVDGHAGSFLGRSISPGSAPTAAISPRSISWPPGMPVRLDRRSLRAEPGLERPRRLGRADRVALAGGDQHPRRHRRRLRRPGDQRMHQHRPPEQRPAARRSRWRGCSRRSNSRGRSPRTACRAATCASTKAAIAAVRRREILHVVAPLAQSGGRSAARHAPRRRRAARRSPRPAAARAPAARTGSRCRRCRGRRSTSGRPSARPSAWKT